MMRSGCSALTCRSPSVPCHRGDGAKPFLFEVEFDELENILLVFDDENFFVIRSWGATWPDSPTTAERPQARARMQAGRIC